MDSKRKEPPFHLMPSGLGSSTATARKGKAGIQPSSPGLSLGQRNSQLSCGEAAGPTIRLDASRAQASPLF